MSPVPMIGPGAFIALSVWKGTTHRLMRMTMRNYDFTPLYRATVGFDRIAGLMDRALSADVGQPTYPPYNIEKTAEDAYRISVAVAGFSEDELNVEVKENTLIITARKAADADGRNFLHRGIATRAFERRFALADHVRVAGAAHALGMLHIDLVREMPEASKPRRIEIARADHVSPTAIDATALETAAH
jgi:molecular chaperone IbpA